MTSGPVIMGLDQPARSHHAPGARRETNVIQLAGRIPLRPANTVARSRGKKDRAPFYPTAMVLVGQREGRLSERSPADRSWAAQAGIHSPVQGDRLSHSFSLCSALKLSQVADTTFNIA